MATSASASAHGAAGGAGGRSTLLPTSCVTIESIRMFWKSLFSAIASQRSTPTLKTSARWSNTSPRSRSGAT
jgi:hypothetical protein